MKLIIPDKVAFTASITEAEIRERLTAEMLEHIGALDGDGNPLPGVSVTVRRGQSRQGGYTIHATGPAPARLRLPRPEEDGT